MMYTHLCVFYMVSKRFWSLMKQTININGKVLVMDEAMFMIFNYMVIGEGFG